MGFGEFWRRFQALAPDGSKREAPKSLEAMRAAVETLLDDLELDKAAVRMGNTQVSAHAQKAFMGNARVDFDAPTDGQRSEGNV